MAGAAKEPAVDDDSTQENVVSEDVLNTLVKLAESDIDHDLAQEIAGDLGHVHAVFNRFMDNLEDVDRSLFPALCVLFCPLLLFSPLSAPVNTSKIRPEHNVRRRYVCKFAVLENVPNARSDRRTISASALGPCLPSKDCLIQQNASLQCHLAQSEEHKLQESPKQHKHCRRAFEKKCWSRRKKKTEFIRLCFFVFRFLEVGEWRVLRAEQRNEIGRTGLLSSHNTSFLLLRWGVCSRAGEKQWPPVGLLGFRSVVVQTTLNASPSPFLGAVRR
jgi:hypothetical protein